MGNGWKPKQLNGRNTNIWVANDVYSPPIHGGNTGSNPVGVTTKKLYNINNLYLSNLKYHFQKLYKENGKN